MAEKIDFSRLAEAALNAVDSLLPEWLPHGHKAGPEYKSVNPTRSDTREGSFSINTVTGRWGDFASGDAGNDLVSLCAYLFHNNDQVAAAYEVGERLGIALPPRRGGKRSDSSPKAGAAPEQGSSSAESPEVKKRRAATEWVPQRVAPADAPPVDKAHVKRSLPERVWHYRDADGATLGYVYRFRTSDGGKEVLPICWARHATGGQQMWRWMHFAEPRPLYGLDDLAGKPDATVLIVEGEKCADVARGLFPDLAVLTWPGGTNAEHKADWSPLAGRKVIIWPDADAKREKLSKAEQGQGIDQAAKPYLPAAHQPGLKAALKIAERLHALDCTVWLVELPAVGTLPDGWDVADMAAAGQIGAGDGEADQAWLRSSTKRWSPAPEEPPSESISTASEAAAEDGWVHRLLRTQKGDIERCVANVYDVLINDEAWRGKLGFDLHAQRIVKLADPPYVNGEAGDWTDIDTTHAGIWVTRRYRFAPGKEIINQAIDAVARNRSFNPVQDWLLKELPAWDGEKRIGSWLERYAGVTPSPGNQAEYVRLISGWFLMGMIARALKPGCKFDYSLILEGPQGKKKSTLLNALVGDRWFSDVELDLGNKDAMMALQGKWLLEIAEMGALARSDEKRQKAFLSRRFDEFRVPFATSFVKLPRQLVFTGTTNEWEWNKDPSGGRRFWPVLVGELDIDGLLAVREQLFAEALTYYQAGKRFWPEWSEQKAYFDPEQLKRQQQEGLIDPLHDWVYQQVSPFSMAVAAKEALNIDPAHLTRDLQVRIGNSLRSLGCTRFEKRNGMTRFWYDPPPKDTDNPVPSSAAVEQKGGVHAGF